MESIPPDYLPDQISAVAALRRQHRFHAENANAVWLPLQFRLDAQLKASEAASGVRKLFRAKPQNHPFE